KITSLKKFERVSQKLFETKNGEKEIEIEQNKFPWDQIFVSGYGPGIRVHATSSFQHYLAVDAVYPLFNYASPLQNPELVLRRLIAAARDKVDSYEEKEKEETKFFSKIQELMKDLLDLKSPNDFKLTTTGIKVDGHWGTSELTELGDGFQALINLMLDLLSWWFLRENSNSEWNLKALKGIVIIDEIEQHLHPKWQRRIFSLLREKFPSIQFIVASHSPLVASANKEVDVHLLSPGKHEKFNPYGWLVENVYERMGMKESRPKDFMDEVINRYRILDKINNERLLNKEELLEFIELKKQLSKMPESDPISLLIEIENATRTLKKSIKE
ncbi:MAG: AAA family ATPase, partial [Nitrosopumilus sp.]